MIFREASMNDCVQLDNLLTKLIDDERRNYDSSISENFVVNDYYKNFILQNNHKIFFNCNLNRTS